MLDESEKPPPAREDGLSEMPSAGCLDNSENTKPAAGSKHLSVHIGHFESRSAVRADGRANRVVIEIGTASFRTTRGYSFAAALCDEIAFWRQDETSASPDVEILRALRPRHGFDPGLNTHVGFVSVCKAWRALRGLPPAFRQRRRAGVGMESRHRDDESADRPGDYCEAYDSDPEAARAEYGAEFRDDLADFVCQTAKGIWTRDGPPGVETTAPNQV